MYFQSDSGDWSQDVEYCFRADGTLARLVGALSSFAADIEGERTIYFDARGGVLLSTRGKRALRRSRTRRCRRWTILDTPPIYPTVASLPFLAAASKAHDRPRRAAHRRDRRLVREPNALRDPTRGVSSNRSSTT